MLTRISNKELDMVRTLLAPVVSASYNLTVHITHSSTPATAEPEPSTRVMTTSNKLSVLFKRKARPVH
jgi:hypothetical protein